MELFRIYVESSTNTGTCLGSDAQALDESMNPLRKLTTLPRDERRMLVVAALRLVLVRTLLSTIGVTRTRRLFAREQGASRVDRAVAGKLALAVERVARHLPLRTNCLDRAVAVWWSLRTHALEGVLRIGVRKEGEATLAAHAWIEHDGVVLFDESAPGFHPFDAPMLVSGKR